MTRTNPGYKPFRKKQVVIWVANFNEIQMTAGGLYTGDDDSVKNRISRLEDAIIVGMSSGCFEGDDWDHKPEIGDSISFKGYAGSIYEHEGNFYRIVEDKFLTTPTIK